MIRICAFCHHAAEPAFNMAFDEVMLLQAAEHPGCLLLRLYSWNPGAITIGLNQTLERAIRNDLVGDTPVVRRITGGRAVYHDVSEATYSVALNLDNPALASWGRTVSEVYLGLAGGLRSFLARLGTTAQIVRRTAADRPERVAQVTAPCFQSVARYELVTGTGKIVASAQRQVGRTILQHGSVKIGGVVRHPALDAGAIGYADDNQPITHESLHEMSTHLTHAFLELAGPGAVVEATDQFDLPGLDERVAMIRRDPLARRIPVER